MRCSALIAALALALVACGGGSSAGPAAPGPSLQTAALSGLVYEVDGQTLDRSGVQVRVLETGDRFVTGLDGRFAFPDLPPGTLTLEFGTSLRAVAQLSADDTGSTSSEAENESEVEDEDDDGNPRVIGVSGGDEAEVRVALQDGRVTEMSVTKSDGTEARMALARDAASPDADVEGKVKVESRSDGDKIEFEAEHLAAGDVVEVFLDDPSCADGFVSIGTATADATGEAKLELDQRDGDSLPLGAASVSELAGFGVEIRLAATGETLLTGEVPDLPEGTPTNGDQPGPDDDARAKTHVEVKSDMIEGEIEVRRREDGSSQRFKVEAEHLDPGTQIAVLMEDPDNPGTFERLGTAVADSEGEAEFEMRTEMGGTLPFDVTDVSELVGLEVRVVLDDGTDTLLFSGLIPPLVAD